MPCLGGGKGGVYREPAAATAAAVPVVTDDPVCVGQLVVGEQHVPGVCDGEEVLGPAQEGALVPPRLLDVYGGG